MRSIINHILQLQELTLIRDEQRSIRGSGADLSALSANINALMDSLQPEIKAIYDRLYKKDHIVMAPMHAGTCSMCGMKLAVSQVQSVKQCQEINACPSCARILYDPSGAKWVAERPKRSTGDRKAGIARFSSSGLMIPDMQASTVEDAILQLTQLMQDENFVDDAKKLADAAIERESIYGTGIGHGIAFPHVRGIEGGGLAMAFAVSRKGIEFRGASTGPAHFIFFSTIPTAVSMFYLKLLAGLADSFTKETNRRNALEANTKDELWKALAKATRYSIK